MSLIFEQRRFGTRLKFTFDRDSIFWQFRSLDGSHEQRLPYHELPLEPTLRTEQSPTLRRLGLLAFLFAAVDAAFAIARDAPPAASLASLISPTWLLVGLTCFALRRVLRLRYSVFASRFNGADVCVMRDDPQHDNIVAELLARRKEARLAYMCPVNVELPLDEDLQHLQKMRDDGLLTESEHREWEAKVRHADRSPEAVAAAHSRGGRSFIH